MLIHPDAVDEAAAARLDRPWIAASNRQTLPQREHVSTSTPNAHSTQLRPHVVAKATPTPLARSMRHTLSLHTSPNGLRGHFLGVRDPQHKHALDTLARAN